MHKIVPCLWFDNQAEEAAQYYVSIFAARGRKAKMGRIARYGKAGFEIHGRPEGSVMIAEFEIEGQSYTALNGGPYFKFNEAISFQVMCDTQEDVNYFWEKLTAGGDPKAQQCGWLKDKFGLSWQIVPTAITELLSDHRSEASQRAMNAVLNMKKPDIAAVKKAYDKK
ncbi:MAG: hypothetical protein A2X67_14760 [Ignavibacteria bacterium GWA2_55_11]|nr:MAG: hypothetical protein A2X67_14760 [Ignavibacteria bacterium GWA2_55_11]OGU71149.1 MAG: hypothetical protein A3G43_09370 [Ignavibacteria bacterium RIFCSPLOWO2_12_FULL_56_21]OGU72011.1 MAG: hypothetical protein A3H45_01685 [Ignavibacteria bacterium RIFCSPLOWO2_02_FULL_55_14]